MAVLCEIAAPFVANSAVEEIEVIWPLRSHTDSCLRCQARQVAMVRTGRQLKSLAEETNTAPHDLEWKVMSSLEGDLAVSRTWAKPLTLTAAALGMVAAVVIWRLRPRAEA